MSLSIKEFVDALTTSWRAALAAWIATSLILAGYIAEIRFLAGAPANVFWISFCVWAWATAVLLASFIHAMIVNRRNTKQRHRQEMFEISQLAELPDDEWDILARHVHRSQRVFQASPIDPAIQALMAKRFINPVGGIRYGFDWPFKIPEHIWYAVMQQVPIRR